MAKIGDKYIIEIDSHMTNKHEDLYGIKELESLVFDQNGLDKLEERKEPGLSQKDIDKARYEGFVRGLNDAWGIARKVAMRSTTQGSYYPSTLYEVFGHSDYQDVLMEHSGLSAYGCVQEYEKRKREEEVFRVGDEVEYKEYKYVITGMFDTGVLDMMDSDGHHYYSPDAKHMKKTGRSFPEVAEVLRKLKEKSHEET